MSTAFIVTLLQRLLSALVTKVMVMGALKIIVAKTEPEWDDATINLIDKLLDNDLDGVQKNALKLVEIVSAEIDKRNNK